MLRHGLGAGGPEEFVLRNDELLERAREVKQWEKPQGPPAKTAGGALSYSDAV